MNQCKFNLFVQIASVSHYYITLDSHLWYLLVNIIQISDELELSLQLVVDVCQYLFELSVPGFGGEDISEVADVLPVHPDRMLELLDLLGFRGVVLEHGFEKVVEEHSEYPIILCSVEIHQQPVESRRGHLLL